MQPQVAITTRRPVAASGSGLITDLWFFWDSPHVGLDLQLLTVNGTIAGAYPKIITKGERLPIHRRFVPLCGTATWYLRIAATGHDLKGLSITVEFKDRIGRTRSLAICSHLGARPDRVLAIEETVEIPDELLL